MSANGRPLAIAPPAARWYHKLAGILFAVFCFEVGLFLLVFPWMDSWPMNYFSTLSPGWRGIWTSNWFRGGLSGLGLVNILISCAELLRLRRVS